MRTLATAALSVLLAAFAPCQDPIGQRGQGSTLELPPAMVPANEEDANLRITPVVKAVQRAADSVVSIYLVDQSDGDDEGQGSGVILDPNGLVITNWHVVWRATSDRSPYQLQARLRDGRQYMARVLSTSPDDDLALMQLRLDAGETVQPIELGDSATLMIGETVVAIGNPRGQANSVTAGVLSAQDREINVRAPDGRIRRFAGLLQTDAAINQGNSGGALLDITGKLIGINNAMAVSAENIGFAIPVNTMKRVFRDVLLTSDNLADIWLGMRVTERSGDVFVAAVDPLGPASRAGIREGDRVLAAAEERIANGVDYARQVLRATPGVRFPLRIEREGRTVDVQPVPLSREGGLLVHRIGLEVETVTRQEAPDLVRYATASFYGSSRRRGSLPAVVRVKQVYPDSPAAQISIQEGDILLGFVFRDSWRDREAPFVSEEDLAEKVGYFTGRTMPVIVLRDERLLDGTLFVRP